jgi:uncharacterized protein
MRQKPVIDGFEFAESGKVLRGACPIMDFPRLRDLLHADAGVVEYAVSGALDREGRPALRIELRGTLNLSCQRCLQPLDFPVALDALLTLARSPSEGDADPVDSDIERVVAGKEMAVCGLLEDELLLSVPFAPSHPVCTPERIGESGRSSPFARLRGLLDPESPGGRNQ